MPDFSSLSSIEGLEWIIVTAFVAGAVRGFAGFGTGLIYMPVAAQFLPPFWTLITIAAMDILGPLPNIRRAWRDADRGDLGRLCLGALFFLPLGLWVLSLVAPEVFRYSVSLLALGMLVVLVSGFRYRGAVSKPLVTTIGATGGFLGGAAGLPGPPIIVFYMARDLPPAVIRGTILLFLLAYDIMLVGYFGISGQLVWTPVVLGLCLTIPNLLGNWIGGRLFQPEKNVLYRRVAYMLIALSAIGSLPFWG